MVLAKQDIVWLRRESNPHLKFRKLPFYPLNYGARRDYKSNESKWLQKEEITV
jgi:hypothetical protein